MFDETGLCFDCVEGMATTLDACVSCNGALRCVNGSSPLLCADNALRVGPTCAPPTEQEALLVTNNHVAKCSETHFASGEACEACPSSCASCTNASSCSVCAGGTSLSPDGTCAALATATAQTHAGAVACDDGHALDKAGACALCSVLFGPGCALCSSGECLSCRSDVVLEGGVCRAGELCEGSDGLACTSCASGSVLFNATDCAAAGGCAVYEDGRCVQCVDPLVLLADGTCAESKDCPVAGDGVCLLCTDGMFADENGVCQRPGSATSHTQRATRRARRARSTRRSARHATFRPECS